MPKSTLILRTFLVVFILCAGWYSIQVYINFLDQMKASSPPQRKTVENEMKLIIEETNDKELKASDEEWNKQQSLFQPIVTKLIKNPCSPVNCPSDKFSFKIITGAANALAPSICFNGSIVMKNTLNNVDRGMNIALFNGKTGAAIRQIVFDLFEQESTEFKKFLKGLKEDEIILIATADDACRKLDLDAKNILADLGSTHSKELDFRDNWAFVGGLKFEHPSPFEKIVKNEKGKNKLGDWPEAITLEGCLPRLT